MKKTSRIHLLISQPDKDMVQRAADIERLTLSSWVVKTVVAEARKVQANQGPLVTGDREALK